MSEADRELLCYASEYTLRLLSAAHLPSKLSETALRLAAAFRNEFDLPSLSAADFSRLHAKYGSVVEGGSCACFQSSLAKMCTDCARVMMQESVTRQTELTCEHDTSFYAAHLKGPALRNFQHGPLPRLPLLKRFASAPDLSDQRSFLSLPSEHHNFNLADELLSDSDASGFGTPPHSPSLLTPTEEARGSFSGTPGPGLSLINVFSHARTGTPLLPAAAAAQGGGSGTPGPGTRRRRGSMHEWEIPFADVTLESKIGAGSFGTVYRARWHGPVAIKLLNLSNPTHAQLVAFRNEVAVLRKTRHTNVLLFIGACTELPNLAIVTRWCEGQSLFHHLHVEGTEFTMLHIMDMAKQTAEGMSYLHAKSIIHRDLKSGNILLLQAEKERTARTAPVVQIADFGLAMVKGQWLDDAKCVCGPTGSVLWMAPEILTMKAGTDPYTIYSDVYAYGIVLYEMLSNCLPYPDCSMEQIIYLVGKGRLSLNFSRIRSDAPFPAMNLMHKCIDRVPANRPVFATIVSVLEAAYRVTPILTRSSSDTLLRMESRRRKAGKAQYAPRPLSIRKRDRRRARPLDVVEDSGEPTGAAPSPPSSPPDAFAAAFSSSDASPIRWASTRAPFRSTQAMSASDASAPDHISPNTSPAALRRTLSPARPIQVNGVRAEHPHVHFLPPSSPLATDRHPDPSQVTYV
eukprot:m.241038 g.241038  ORF g.241038 m.241038 type:complete len:686 (-) comp23887_c0_seq1:36-2093(-)